MSNFEMWKSYAEKFHDGKIMVNVICVSNEKYPLNFDLEIGKVYPAYFTIFNNIPYYDIFFQDGSNAYYDIDCFITKAEHRDNQIDSIINGD